MVLDLESIHGLTPIVLANMPMLKNLLLINLLLLVDLALPLGLFRICQLRMSYMHMIILMEILSSSSAIIQFT